MAVGGKYHLNNHWTITSGFGHDQTPTQIGFRDIRLPDNNRYVLSFGVDYLPKPGMTWSLGWAHLFVPTTRIDNSKSSGFPITVGEAKGDINVIGVQFSCVV